jgi:excisionase family DNA binding protein
VTTAKYLRVSEAAPILGITQKAVRQRIARGELPYRRWGRRVLIPWQELERFLATLPGRTADEAVAAVEEGRGWR